MRIITINNNNNQNIQFKSVTALVGTPQELNVFKQMLKTRTKAKELSGDVLLIKRRNKEYKYSINDATKKYSSDRRNAFAMNIDNKEEVHFLSTGPSASSMAQEPTCPTIHVKDKNAYKKTIDRIVNS